MTFLIERAKSVSITQKLTERLTVTHNLNIFMLSRFALISSAFVSGLSNLTVIVPAPLRCFKLLMISQKSRMALNCLLAGHFLRGTNHQCWLGFVPVHLGASESAILLLELELEARNVAELVVGDDLSPAANVVDVVDGDYGVELGGLVVHEAGLDAELTTNL